MVKSIIHVQLITVVADCALSLLCFPDLVVLDGIILRVS